MSRANTPPELSQVHAQTLLEQSDHRTTKLNFRNWALEVLPVEIRRFTNLQSLNISKTGISSIPTWIGDLKQLRQLDISDNRIAILPEEIGRLSSLEIFDISRNHLSILPNTLTSLSKLRELNCRDNYLQEFPEVLCTLEFLQELYLSCNHLSALPANIKNCKSLGFLHLRKCGLTSLPAQIGALRLLRRLIVGENQLVELPRELGQLENLESLDIRDNLLTSLPASIGDLHNLRRIHLTANRISNLPPEIGNLTKIESLNLARQDLASLPAEIGQMKGLRTLDLEGNKLQYLPETIGILPRLEKIAVGSNQLRELPSTLAEPVDAGLSVTGIGTNEALTDLAGLKRAELVSYLASLPNAIRLYEAKLLLVGEGEVGKTSLVNALLGEDFVEGMSTTHGIEVRTLLATHLSNDEVMTLRMWDFGGQEVYRITHQFFFSARALYILVWNSRKNQKQCDVDGWLRRIRLRVGPKARVLIVATHGSRQPEIDYAALQRHFGSMLRGHFTVENSNGQGITELSQAIAAESSELPLMGRPLNRRWMKTRDAISELSARSPHIDYKTYIELCGQNGMSIEESEALAALLHELGTIVYYGDDDSLRDIVILDPEWLTKAISYVLEDRATRRANGVLEHERLKHIWTESLDGPSYPRRYHRYLLRLMEKFEICYRIDGDTHRSLVAQVVPHARPNLPWTPSRVLPVEARQLSALFCLSDEAPGLIPWLTVRWHDDSIGLHWRNGVLLRHRDSIYQSEALFELEDERNLRLTVRAPSPDLYFNALRDSVENLIRRRWPGLKYETLVPCASAVETFCSGYFKLSSLLRFRVKNRKTIDCQECGDSPDISRLLTGYSAMVDSGSIEKQLHLLSGRLESIDARSSEIARIATESAHETRLVLKVASTEVTDCPRVFTLVPSTGNRWHPKQAFTSTYNLTLWCEYPGQWHPCWNACYSLQQPKEWLSAVAPYAKFMLQALRLVVPIAKDVLGVTMPEDDFKAIQAELELMKTIVAGIPKTEPNPASDTSHHLQGSALRGFRHLLFTQDVARSFGGLRRFLLPTGEYIWVCPSHTKEYIPGLPHIP